MTPVTVDIDGSGPQPPANVLCGLDPTGAPVIAISHDMEEKTKVDGFQAPGSFSQTLHYQVRNKFYYAELP